MYRTILAMALVLTFSNASAVRTIELIEGGYELYLRDVTLPSSTAGTVIFKTCEDCDQTSLRVNGSTRYLVNDAELSLADFAAAAKAVPSGADNAALVGVFYLRETQAVTRISLHTR